MSIPKDFITQLVEQTDLLELVGRYVKLKKQGANYVGLCPFHNEKSPSFSVNPAKGFYHCFGCGESGNAIGFLTKYTGANFVEVVHDLARENGMSVPEENISPQEKQIQEKQKQQQNALEIINQKAANYYQSQLKTSNIAIDYLKKRGLKGEIARDFLIGYAPDGWKNLANVFANYQANELIIAGLIIVSEEDNNKRYDRFRGRIIFPIKNVNGQIIGFGARALGDEKPKYLNSPETPIFSKGRELYGLYEAKKAIRDKGYVIVTEGYMDVLALVQNNFANSVAALGTACTPIHVQKLFKYTENIIFAFDGDNAGKNAAVKAMMASLTHIKDGRSIKFLFLPDNHDPDSYIKENGANAFENIMKNAMPISQFLLSHGQKDCDMSLPEGRANFLHQIKPLWNELPKSSAFSIQILNEISKLAEFTVEQIFQTWKITVKKDFTYKINQPFLKPAFNLEPKPVQTLPPRQLTTINIVEQRNLITILHNILLNPKSFNKLVQERENISALVLKRKPFGTIFEFLYREYMDNDEKLPAIDELLELAEKEEFKSFILAEMENAQKREIPPEDMILAALNIRLSDIENILQNAGNDINVIKEYLPHQTNLKKKIENLRKIDKQ